MMLSGHGLDFLTALCRVSLKAASKAPPSRVTGAREHPARAKHGLVGSITGPCKAHYTTEFTNVTQTNRQTTGQATWVCLAKKADGS